MKQLTGSGRRNPMVQRLQRYTAMPAIFRAVDTPVMPAAVPDGSLEPVVKTFILPPHTFAAPPAELVSAPETAVSPEAVVQTADAPQQFPVPTDQPTPPPIQRAAQPTPTPPTAVPTSPPVPTSKPTEQSAWSRLKAAAKQVQRAVTGEPSSPPPAPTPAEMKTAVSQPAAAIPQPPTSPPAWAASPADSAPLMEAAAGVQREPASPGAAAPPPLTLIPIETDAPPAQPGAAPDRPHTPAERQDFASPSPQPAPPAAGADADPISRRLDQIMRKHREAGTIETPPEMAARSQTTAVPPTPPPTVETPVETHNLASPSPQPTPPAAGADADPISRRLDQIMRKHREAGTIETPPEMVARSQTTAVPPTPPPTVETPAERQDFASPSPQPAPPAPAPIMREPQEVDGLETPSETAAMQPETAVSHSPLSNPQPAGPPLQAAWPVQIVETPGPLPPPFTPSSGPLMRQTAPAETAKVRQQLDGIPPGQPSDSSVQFIRPRKPRPQPAAPKTEAIQRQESLVPDGAEVAVPPSPSPATPPPPAKVATEIGELPGDLWRLIGQEPPKTAGSGTAVTNTAPPTTLMQPDAPPSATIQRAEAEPAPAEELAPAPEAPPASPREGGETGQAAEVDVDELARQVYGELKERMSIEWERTRGRF